MSQTKAQLLGPLVGNDIDVEGDLNFDSGTFKVDPVNDRVGIKNSNPTKTLDVGGDTQVADLYYTADYPTIRPTLDLAFDKVKRLDSRVTFTRTSTATYVDENGIIQTAAVDEPRFDHDPVTGESLGLLIEESRTNLIAYSDNMDGWNGATAGVTYTLNSATSPDGDTNAIKFLSNSGGATGYDIITYTYPSSSVYTYSFYAKAGNWNKIKSNAYKGSYWASTTFVLTGDGSVESTTYGETASITPVGNGWYRCVVTSANTVASGSGESSVSFPSDTPAGGYVYLWGFQNEAGAFPTSYIPTSGSTVTRAYDVVSMNGTNFTNWYNQTEGTIFFNFKTGNYVPATDGMRLFRIANSSNIGQNRVDYVVSTSGSYQPYLRSNTVEYYDGASDIGFTTNTDFNIALTIKENDIYGYINGSLSTEDTTFSTFTADQIDLGSIDGGSSVLNGHIKRLTYYPRRLNNSQLQNITL